MISTCIKDGNISTMTFYYLAYKNGPKLSMFVRNECNVSEL